MNDGDNSQVSGTTNVGKNRKKNMKKKQKKKELRVKMMGPDFEEDSIEVTSHTMNADELKEFHATVTAEMQRRRALHEAA